MLLLLRAGSLEQGPTTVSAVTAPRLGSFTTASAARGVAEGIGSGTLNAFSGGAVVRLRGKASASPSFGAFTSSAAATVSDVEPIAAFAAPRLASFLSGAAAKALIEGWGSGVLNAFGATSPT